MATTSTNPPTVAQESLKNPGDNTDTKVEEVEKKSDDHDEELDFDPNKFASEKDYETYKGRFRKLDDISICPRKLVPNQSKSVWMLSRTMNISDLIFPRHFRNSFEIVWKAKEVF